MKTKLLFGLLIGIGTVIMLFMAFPIGLIICIAFWIHLGVMHWKGKPVFHKRIEAQLAKRRWKNLIKLFIVALIMFLAAVVGIVMHNVESGLTESEESIYFFVGIISTYLFILTSIIGMVIFLKARQKPNNKAIK